MRRTRQARRACALLAALLTLCALLSGAAETVGIPGERLLQEGDIVSEAAILIEASAGTVLFEKNADRAMYPASTT